MRNYFDLGILAIPLTILWIVGLTNAMNLIDGLDGLATGIAMFTSIALFLVIIGLLGGFLARELNVFGKERRVMEREFRYLKTREAETDGRQMHQDTKDGDLEKLDGIKQP